MTQQSPRLPVFSGGKNPAILYVESLGSPRSSVTMLNCLDNIAKILGRSNALDCDWGALRRQHIQFVINTLKARKIAPATVNLNLYCLKGVAREAYSHDIMPQAAYMKISIMKGLTYQRLPVGRSLTAYQCRKLLDACNDGTLRGCRDKALLAVMMGCGLRRAEITGLQMHHWNAKDSSFTFVGKGNKQRKVYLPPDLVPILQSWFEVKGSEEIMFPGIYQALGTKPVIRERAMLPSSIYRIVQKRAEQAKIPTITPHDLRRTFASRMLDAGIDLFVLQQSMGHASLAITARYDRRGDKAKAKAARALHF